MLTTPIKVDFIVSKGFWSTKLGESCIFHLEIALTYSFTVLTHQPNLTSIAVHSIWPRIVNETCMLMCRVTQLGDAVTYTKTN